MEKDRMKQFSHPNILSYLAVSPQSDTRLALPRFQGYVSDIVQFRLNYDQVFSILEQVVSALVDMKAEGWVHFNPRLHNIMFSQKDDEISIVLSYLDTVKPSCTFDDEGYCDLRSWSGSEDYTPPEVINELRAHINSDAYLLGIMAWELLHGKRGRVSWETREDLEPEFVVLLEGALAEDPRSRLSLEQFSELLAAARSNVLGQ